MKNTIKAVVLGLSLLASVSVCYAQDFDKGMDAYLSEDYATALREWRPLAAQSDVEAQFFLGVMYATGQGVIKDNVYAHMWWNIAASSGYASAVNNREIVAGKMTAADISKAQDATTSCQERFRVFSRFITVRENGVEPFLRQ